MNNSVLNAKRRAMAKKQKPKAPGSTHAHGRVSKIDKRPAPSSIQPRDRDPPTENCRDEILPTSASSNGMDRRSSEYPADCGGGSNSEDYEDEPEVEEEDIDDYRKGGYHSVKIGDTFKKKRYKVVRKLGWGHFSTVWLAYDRDKDIHVALKIVKSAAHYTEAALDEIELCTRTVSVREPHVGRDYVAKLLDSFEHSGQNGRHVCMVFEVLGENLLSLIRNARRYSLLRDVVCTVNAVSAGNGGRRQPQQQGTAEHVGLGTYNETSEDKTRSSDGLPIPLVKRIARQIIAGLAYLHGPCNMIHTDLKPENVLVCIDNVEDAIRLELRNDAISNNVQDKTVLVQTSRSVANSRAPSPGGENAARAALEKDLNDISIAGTPSLSRHGSENSLQRASSATPSDRLLNMNVKLADLGNATWADHHFTEDIQTRQYRSPEVIIGARWNANADIWSCACLVFELLTGDYLFEPRSGSRYSKDEEHIAQIIEIIAPFPRKFALSGKFSSELFNRRGELRHICRLYPFPLKELLHDEYGFAEHESREIADFLLPMLEINPARRSSAESMLLHRWLQ
ncbi:kinase-like protein [Coemansia reversa NRRL 1564]|uniref:non-specific serine/threonine protein kinase n=1 Tax=Coemansia reversa (strain ATCC 12441 / NRRL 1564) TaxID=763665 RepID=A0A2G5B8G4_COERN|nr:kinase-like protein [Coemansia reversa NRRL 1564]|eukprot:PIA15291.1 kinase-like protein [Coemansia reversa NRRL 1564]